MPPSDADQWAAAGGQALRQSQTEQLRNSVQQALAVNPDQFAETKRLAAATGMPIQTAQNMPDVAKVQAQMSHLDADRLVQVAPNLSRWLGVQANANVAHDDIPNAAAVEGSVTALPQPAAPAAPSFAQRLGTSAFWTDLAKYTVSANDGKDNLTSDVYTGLKSVSGALGSTLFRAAGTIGMGADWLGGKVNGTPGNYFRDLAFEQAARYANQADTAEEGTSQSFGSKLVRSVTQLGVQLPMMLATGGESAVPAATDAIAKTLGLALVHGTKAMAVPALADASETTRKVYEKTGDMNAAVRAGQTQYAISTLGGVVPLSAPGGVFTRLAGGGAVGTVQGEVGREAMNLALPTSMQREFSPEDLVLSGVTGGLLAGVMGPRHSPDTQAAVRRFNAAHDALVNESRTVGQTEQLMQLAQAAATSKLRERDPLAFKDFVKQTAENGELQGVYIEAPKLAEVLAQHGITGDELHQTMPEVADQLAQMRNGELPTNALVRIPIEDFATHIAGSELEKPLMQSLRVSSEGGTVGETQELMQSHLNELQTQADRIAGAAESHPDYQASVEKVKTDLTTRLQAIGMRPDIAEANAAPLAAFYQVHADRMGMLPHEFAEAYPVQFSNKALEGLSQESRGTFSPSTKTISVLKGANLSTFQHELGHYFLDTLAHLAAQPDAPASVREDMGTLLKHFGVESMDAWHQMSLDEQRVHHEAFATGWETYLMKGQAPTLEMRSLFARFRAWMLNVYQNLKGAPGEFTREVRGVFDRMIASEDAIHQAELARKYMPLFDSPEKAGMSPEEWAAYQAQGRDATEQAIEQLLGKTLKDMAWMDRLRTASLKGVEKDAAEKRKVITREVRAEVMSQPIYRAWAFLTGKDSSSLPDEVNAEHQQAVRAHAEQRTSFEAKTKARLRAEAWEASDASKAPAKNPGLAKGQWLAKSRARIDLDVQRAMLDWDQANPKPKAPEKADNRVDPNNPTTGAGKLNLTALREAFGAEMTKRLQDLKMTGAKGLDPGVVADMFGFADADSLVKALAGADKPREMIEGLTDQRMLERHGEISSPEAMAQTADALVQNEVRARFVATELRALKKATGKPSEIAKAAKEVAGNTIDTQRVRDINEGRYNAAETRSASQAERAMVKGDTEGAAVAKRDQLLNMELARAAREAKDFVEKALNYLAKFDRAGVRENIDLEYRDQIDALLDRADLRKSVSGTALDKREALLAFVERMAADGYQPQIPESLLNEAQRWHYKDMPLVAFRGLVDSVKSIEHLGKLKNELRDLQETRRINDLADEMAASAARLPQRAPESDRGLTRMQAAWVKTKSFGRSAEAAMLKMEQMFDWLDARNPNGVLNRVVFRRLSEAATHENTLLADVKGRIDALVHDHLADITKERGKVYTAAGLIDKATGQPQKFTTKEMLMLAGNMGNESNVAKLVKGEGWDERAVWEFLHQNMTKAHWGFVAGMGRALESLWPEKLAMDRRLGNTSPEKIQPRAFSTPHGDYAGWYWPLMYDPARSQDVAERGARQGDALFENIYSRANTDTGRMNTRSESYARPLLLDLDALPRMIKDEIHDISHREAVIDADRFLSHPTVRKAIISALSQEHYDQLRPWLQSIANDGKLSTDGARGMEFFNTIAREARTRATIVGLGFRVSTAMVHGMSAAAESISELGAKWTLSGLKDFANPGQWSANKDFVFERSGEMRNRMNEVDRDVREHLRQIDTGLMDPTSSALSRGSDLIKAHAYSMIAGLDMASALPTWMGAYKKALTPVDRGGLGLGEQDAVYFADKTVRNAHGGTGVKDMARIQRGSEFQKLFTMFYTFWNHNINRIMDTAKLVTSSEHRALMQEANHWSDTQLAATVIMRTLVYTLGVQALHSLVHPPKKDEDKEHWAAWAGKELVASAFAGIPIARDISAHFLTGRDYSATPAASMVDAVGKTGQDAAAALTGKQVSDKWLKHAVQTSGYVFNLPTGQVSGTAQFLWDVGQGRQHPQSAKEWWNGLLHGDAKQH